MAWPLTPEERTKMAAVYEIAERLEKEGRVEEAAALGWIMTHYIDNLKIMEEMDETIADMELEMEERENS